MAQLPVLTPQTRQFLALSAARAVLSAAFIAIGLTNPVPDRLGGRLELTRQLLRGSPTSDQINHLSPEFRRIGSVTLRHRWHLLLKWKGVHRTGSTPDPLELVGRCLVDGEPAKVEIGYLDEGIRALHEIREHLALGKRLSDAALKCLIEFAQCTMGEYAVSGFLNGAEHAGHSAAL